jgi:hypothetical protein
VALIAAGGCASLASTGSPLDVQAGATPLEVMAALDAEAAEVRSQQTMHAFLVLVIAIALAVALGGAPPTGG